MAEPRYLIRLDDACPWMDKERWGRIEVLLDRFSVKPLVAVIPECRDQEVQPQSPDPEFWNRVRSWRDKGWSLAMHGHTHELRASGSSLVPLNRITEFAGQAPAVQRDKIRQGWSKFQSEGIEPTHWVAPAHTFDRTTLEVLREETSIRTISDGLSSTPFVRYGFCWIPQQLWRPRVLARGTWTICLHPNDHTVEFEAALEAFLVTSRANIADWKSLPPPTRRWGLGDLGFEWAFRSLRFAKRMFRR